MSESLTAESCFDSLRAVIDPEIFQSIVDLGLVYAVDVRADNIVDVTMTLTTEHCPMGPQILGDVERVLLEDGASTVNIDLVWEPRWTPDAMTDDLKRELGILPDDEPEPEPVYSPPPLPQPAKKGFFGRLFGR